MRVSYVSSLSPFHVVKVKDDPKAYRYLTEAYLNWVYEPACDMNYNKMVQIDHEPRHITFMRDDSIGDPKNPDEEDMPNIQEISTAEGADIFFPVYYFYSSIGEKDGKGGYCNTPEDCLEAAKDDLSKVITDDNGNPMIEANISINGEEAVPITSNFDDHTFTMGLDSEFAITVGDNFLNREPEYHLKPGTHPGVVRGTFMYLRNFKKGNYILYFGGEASNFITHSVYTLHVD